MGDEKVGGRVLHHTPRGEDPSLPFHSTVIGRFEQLVSGTAPRQHLPPALVKERKRQRGDDNEEAAAEEPKSQDGRARSPGKGSSAGTARQKFIVRPITAPPPRSRKVRLLGVTPKPEGPQPPNSTAAPLSCTQTGCGAMRVASC